MFSPKDSKLGGALLDRAMSKSTGPRVRIGGAPPHIPHVGLPNRIPFSSVRAVGLKPEAIPKLDPKL
jgi:hypothetical protein